MPRYRRQTNHQFAGGYTNTGYGIRFTRAALRDMVHGPRHLPTPEGAFVGDGDSLSLPRPAKLSFQGSRQIFHGWTSLDRQPKHPRLTGSLPRRG